MCFSTYSICAEQRMEYGYLCMSVGDCKYLILIFVQGRSHSNFRYLYYCDVFTDLKWYDYDTVHISIYFHIKFEFVRTGLRVKNGNDMHDTLWSSFSLKFNISLNWRLIELQSVTISTNFVQYALHLLHNKFGRFCKTCQKFEIELEFQLIRENSFDEVRNEPSE